MNENNTPKNIEVKVLFDNETGVHGVSSLRDAIKELNGAGTVKARFELNDSIKEFLESELD